MDGKNDLPELPPILRGPPRVLRQGLSADDMYLTGMEATSYILAIAEARTSAAIPAAIPVAMTK
jgi:hypothetical protein